jgi:Ca-activated chloride channel family protein
MRMKLWLVWCVWSLVLVGGVQAERLDGVEEGDHTLAPYFFVHSQSAGEDDLPVDHLPLKSTDVDIRVAGVIADYTVRQVYYNEGSTPLEATYIFPASSRAAVYAMQMRTGDRVITAEIRERKKAKQEYVQAKKEGKRASLLEQQRPNVFQMNVANIMPGDQIEVELKYTELLIPEKGVYEIAFPTVVGPRYSTVKAGGAPATEQWLANPYRPEGDAPRMTYNIGATVLAGMPIQDLACASHDVDARFSDPATAIVALRPNAEYGGDRDFILKYRLAGERVESGLLLFEGEQENFFLLMVQPPKTVTPAQMPARDYTFVVDVSGSMHGFPLDTSKSLLKDLIGGLHQQDTFNVVLFAGTTGLLSPKSLSGSPQNIKRAINLIDNQTGAGGTELMPALQQAYALPSERDLARSIVVVTDGYVSVEREAFLLISEMLGTANVFSFGIGSSVNRFLIEGMARAGMGEPMVVTGAGEAASKADRFREYIGSPALTGIKVDFGGFDVYDVNPGAIPDLMAERPIVIFGKWQGKPTGEIRVTGVSGDGAYEQRIPVTQASAHEGNGALRYLWARHRIAVLDDYNRLDSSDEGIAEVTALGLKYNLLTQYTSFLAVDKVVVNPGGDLAKVKQPLPLPKGVENSAVGGAAAAPEPETYALLFVAAIVLFAAYRRRQTDATSQA